ncbi:MAG: DUF4957 domain-containing protein, partial [Prevotella sp.]|nr:DUF4957 domain-containing protein [Prevotella sp.]
MKKKLLSFFALTVIGVLAFAATQATQASRRAGAVDITIAAADITEGDISAALTAKITALGADETVGNITITLDKAVAYKVTSAIKAPANLTINGNGAKIDATATETDGGINFIELQGSTEKAIKADGVTESDHYLTNSVTVKDVTVSGLKKAIIRDTQKTLLKTLTIDNSVIEASNAKVVVDFDGKGYVEQLNVKNSTIWAAAGTGKHFAKYGSRPKNLWTKDESDADVPGIYTKQGFDVQNSTFVNIAVNADLDGGANFNNLSQKGTDNNIYTLKNNIFVNCGKSGQVVIGFNGGQASATPVWDVDKNAFNWNGADVAVTEVSKAGKKNDEDIVKNSVEGVVVFADAANGDFTLGDCAQKTAGIGDPRWIFYDITVSTTIANGTVTVDKEKANKGETVTITATPEEGYFMESLAVTGVTTNESVTVNGGKFVMPADAVVINAMFRKYVDVTLAAADITGNISDAISGKVPAGEVLRNVTITLAANTEYTVSAPIVAGGSVVINGAAGAKINASSLEDAFIKMSGTPAVTTNEKGAYLVDAVTIKDVEITGLKNQLIYGNKQKYLIGKLSVDNSVIGIDGTAKKTIFD